MHINIQQVVSKSLVLSLSKEVHNVCWKSGNISETVLDRDVVTTDYLQEVILVYGLSNSSSCNDLEFP